MGSIYLAIDINEECGRHILGYLDNGRLKLEEIHKFDIKYIDRDDKKLWDLKYIFEEVKKGIISCRECDKLPVFVGITACDGHFVLLDPYNKVIDDMVFNLDKEEMFESFTNDYAGYIERTDCFLSLSDYFYFLLTGNKQCEYTNLLPRMLISWDSKDLDEESIKKLGFSKLHFPRVSQPGNVIGNLTLEVTEEVGYDFIIIQVASRKASSAILKMPIMPEEDIQGDNDIQDNENLKGNVNLQDNDKDMQDNDNDIKDDNNDNQDDDKDIKDDDNEIQDYNKDIQGDDKDIKDDDKDKDVQNAKIQKTVNVEAMKTSDIIADEHKAAIGCLCILMITSHELKDFEAARECIRNTFYTSQ